MATHHLAKINGLLVLVEMTHLICLVSLQNYLIKGSTDIIDGNVV